MLYCDDIIKIEDFDFDNILTDKKPYANILVYNISYKALIDCKLFRIRLYQKDEFFRVYAGTRYLILFGC